MNSKRMRLVSNVVIAYMLIAFCWWSILLFTKNKDAFEAKVGYMQIVFAAENANQTPEDFFKTEKYQNLSTKYQRQEWMIFGEATLFVLSLIAGIFFINRGYRKEMHIAQQQRNFLLSITHELKSPIASLKLALETFVKRDLPSDKIKLLSQNGIHEADRLNDLVNNLLLAAKVETAYQPTMESIDLNGVIEEAVDRMVAKFPQSSIAFNASIPSGFFNGDRFGLNAIIINLIENAIKYSPAPGHVQLNLKHTTEDQVVLTCADLGHGVPENEQKHIFEKFYRVGNEDTRQTKGTGLGLYIVWQIVKAHQGKIKVGNNQPKGTIFTIQFPGKRFSIKEKSIEKVIA